MNVQYIGRIGLKQDRALAKTNVRRESGEKMMLKWTRKVEIRTTEEIPGSGKSMHG